MVTELWAHTPGKGNPEEWQSLEKHLEGVAKQIGAMKTGGERQ